MVLPNCPVWIPASLFQDQELCAGSFIWNGTLPQLTKSTRHLPVQMGGLALPNFQVYYWAAVLVTMYWWFEGPHCNAAVCVEAAWLGSPLDLQNLVYRVRGPMLQFRVQPADLNHIKMLWWDLNWQCMQINPQTSCNFRKFCMEKWSNISPCRRQSLVYSYAKCLQ